MIYGLRRLGILLTSYINYYYCFLRAWHLKLTFHYGKAAWGHSAKDTGLEQHVVRILQISIIVVIPVCMKKNHCGTTAY